MKIAKNMCVSLGATIVSDSAPTAGKLADLMAGSVGINQLWADVADKMVYSQQP